jgi:hypothetical protein
MPRKLGGDRIDCETAGQRNERDAGRPGAPRRADICAMQALDDQSGQSDRDGWMVCQQVVEGCPGQPDEDALTNGNHRCGPRRASEKRDLPDRLATAHLPEHLDDAVARRPAFGSQTSAHHEEDVGRARSLLHDEFAGGVLEPVHRRQHACKVRFAESSQKAIQCGQQQLALILFRNLYRSHGLA